MALKEQRTWLRGISLILVLFSISNSVQAQWNFFAIELTEYTDVKDPMTTPLNTLTTRAIEKRYLRGLSIDHLDVEINPQIINDLKEQNMKIVYRSRWLKTIVVATQEKTIPKRDFIKKYWLVDTLPLNKWPTEKSSTLDSGKILTKGIKRTDVYGESAQISDFLGLRELHANGFTGEGIDVVVFDGGFSNVNRLSAFDTLKAQGRFWFYKDYSQNNSHLFTAGQHGTQVLSCMAAYLPGIYVGTGYGANYGVMATETGRFESPLEEWAWIQGIEEADRLGADLVQCSLGYTTFDNEEFNHTHQQLANLDIPIFKAAKIATQKGMVMVNSAGNEGGDSWKYVGFPSGSNDVIAVAAAFSNGKVADFSSHGYKVGPAKPNVTAIGVRTPAISAAGYVVGATGTSFAAPSLAGGMACLMQLVPNRNPEFYKNLLQAISSHSMEHSKRSGYGIPNFSLALNYTIKKSKMPFYSNQSNLDTLYNGQEIKTFRKPHKKYTLVLKGKNKGKMVMSFSNINNLATGVKIANLNTGEYTMCIRQGLRKWKKRIYFVESESIND